MKKEIPPIVENLEEAGIKKVKYLSVECNYQKVKNAPGQENGINFTLGEFNNREGFGNTSFIGCSIEDARDFAKLILELCNDISRDNKF